MCAEAEFQCKVSKMCIDSGMKCNEVSDCNQWNGWEWDDDSDETGCGKLSGDLMSY